MIIFLHGNDTYRSKKKLQELQQKFFNEVDKQGYNLTALSGHDCTIEKIIEAVSAMPFMATKRMVLVEDLSQMNIGDKEEQSMLDVIQPLLESDTIFVVWEGELGKRQLAEPIFSLLQKSK